METIATLLAAGEVDAAGTLANTEYGSAAAHQDILETQVGSTSPTGILVRLAVNQCLDAYAAIRLTIESDTWSDSSRAANEVTLCLTGLSAVEALT